MIEVVPAKDNPIYQHWKMWYYINQREFTSHTRSALNSIEEIAEFIFKDKCSCIIGHMIMMKDLEEMETAEYFKEMDAIDRNRNG